MDPGGQKGPKSVLLRKIELLFLRQTRELMFALKYLFFNVLTGNYHLRSGKNL